MIRSLALLSCAAVLTAAFAPAIYAYASIV